MATGIKTLEKYKGWTIEETGDGILAIHPHRGNCLSGGHSSVADARKSVDYFEMANGDPHVYHLLWGHGGWDHLAVNESIVQPDGREEKMLAKRDNGKYRPTYAYNFKADVAPASPLPITVRQVVGKHSAPKFILQLTAEDALALSNLLRDAAITALEYNTRKAVVEQQCYACGKIVPLEAAWCDGANCGSTQLRAVRR